MSFNSQSEVSQLHEYINNNNNNNNNINVLLVCV